VDKRGVLIGSPMHDPVFQIANHGSVDKDHGKLSHRALATISGPCEMPSRSS
jgi:hypothetical protein